MNLALRQKTESMPKVHQPHSKKELLPRRIYLLERSLDRYEYLRKRGAPVILMNAEVGLIRSRLLSIGAELTK